MADLEAHRIDIPTELPKINIKVQTITGRAFPIAIQPTATVLQLKQILEATPGIEVPPDRQRLYFLGSELNDGQVLNDPARPIKELSTIQIMLRTTPPTYQNYNNNYNVQMPNMPNNLDPVVYYPPLLVDDAQGRVEKSALHIRLFGIFFVVVGVVNFIFTIVSGIDWVNISTSALIAFLGLVAIHTGVTRTTNSARTYLLSILLWILAFAGIFISSSIIADPDPSSSNVLVTVLVGIFFPIFLCSFCAFCAKRHLSLCRARDEMELHLIPQVGYMGEGAMVQPLLGEGGN